MTDLMRDYSRRQFLKVMGAAAGAVGLGGIAAACSTAASSSAPAATSAPTAAATAAASSGAVASAALPTGTFNWMTWGDHSYPAQLDAIAASDSIKANSTLFSDNIDAYTVNLIWKP